MFIEACILCEILNISLCVLHSETATAVMVYWQKTALTFQNDVSSLCRWRISSIIRQKPSALEVEQQFH